jgi:CDP-diacylglycerol---glycerol-3-phosphate 3-phosphatidyltransferase
MKKNNQKMFLGGSNLANKITLARILLVPIFIVLLVSDFPNSKYYALAFYLILALSDLLDGYIARKRNEITQMGAILDPLADKLLVGAALIFLIGRGVDAWMAYTIIVRELVITALRSVVSTKTHTMSAKISGKIKTLSQNIAICAVLLGLYYSNLLMLIATIITIYSGLEYLWLERKALKGSF